MLHCLISKLASTLDEEDWHYSNGMWRRMPVDTTNINDSYKVNDAWYITQTHHHQTAAQAMTSVNSRQTHRTNMHIRTT